MKTTRNKGPVKVQGVHIKLSLEDLDQFVRDRAQDEFGKKVGQIRTIAVRPEGHHSVPHLATPPMPEAGWSQMTGAAPALPRGPSPVDVAQSRLTSAESAFKVLSDMRDRHRGAVTQLEATDPTNGDSIPAASDLLSATRDLIAAQVYFWRVCAFLDGPSSGSR